MVTQRCSPVAKELCTRGESESETRLRPGITTTMALSSDVTKLLRRDVGRSEAWQRRRGCRTTWIRNRGAMLSKGSGAAPKRGLLHDRFIGTTAGQRYGTIAHGSRIKDGSRDTGGYMSDSAAMLPSADGIHNMAANVQLCSTSSPPQDLVTTTCLPDWEPAQEGTTLCSTWIAPDYPLRRGVCAPAGSCYVQ